MCIGTHTVVPMTSVAPRVEFYFVVIWRLRIGAKALQTFNMPFLCCVLSRVFIKADIGAISGTVRSELDRFVLNAEISIKSALYFDKTIIAIKIVEMSDTARG